jgi:hypothetical protein
MPKRQTLSQEAIEKKKEAAIAIKQEARNPKVEVQAKRAKKAQKKQEKEAILAEREED